MKLISVWSPKGGVGKSTIACNLASGYAAQGLNVLLCDTDEQQSLYELYTKGGVDWEAIVGIPEKKPNYDVVIIDHAPSHTTAPSGGFVLLPMRPSRIDYNSFVKSVSLLDGKRFLPIINAVDFRNKEEKEMALNMEKQGAFVIKRRSIYPRSFGLDKTVFGSGRLYGAPEARKEMNRLIGAIG